MKDKRPILGALVDLSIFWLVVFWDHICSLSIVNNEGYIWSRRWTICDRIRVVCFSHFPSRDCTHNILALWNILIQSLLNNNKTFLFGERCSVSAEPSVLLLQNPVSCSYRTTTSTDAAVFC